MNRWRIALRSFRDLCAFVGLIVMVSYFYNWTADIRHWYVTLASAFVCSVLWRGFYVVRRSSVPAKKSFQEAGKWHVPQGGGEEARWKSGGKQLFYSSQDVFTYSVGGDGQRFLVNTIIDEPNATPLSITLNWAERLKEKVPSPQTL